MTKTIFCGRNENALSYAFLVILWRLTQETRAIFLKNCGLDALNGLGKLKKIDSQSKLSTRRQPDGILFFSEGLVVFENKVQDFHNSDQLERYRKQVPKDHKSQGIRFLVCANRTVQSSNEIKHELETAGIALGSSDIVFWQDVFPVCRKLVEGESARSSCSNDVDRFLLEELGTLLEEMDLVEKAYDGLTANGIQTFMDTRIQLERLEQFFTNRVPQELAMLECYDSRDTYSSLFKDRLGFSFAEAHGESRTNRYTYLFLRLRSEGELVIGINSGNSKDLEKLRENIDRKSVVEEVVKLGNYSIRYGSRMDQDVVTPSDFLDASEPFKARLQIRRIIPFATLETDFKLKTPDFPSILLDEVLRLRKIIELFNDAL